MSFDANVRGLPEDSQFFVEVHSCHLESPLYKIGVRKGDSLYCVMLKEDRDDPTILVLKGNTGLAIRDSECNLCDSLVYAGMKDMTGFTHIESKQKAKEVLNKLYEKK